ncbi:RrF2 family transcriptional regulator [Mucilaginibacter myungsuensis]|uniref:Rrf2 family transcriptional regulator n=1 Tax=Mucilaginibacter myungsuensis TaxID=649104 RepID=A0A929PY95_9SPHI|nr:Rrf2 family transcriptional regulator [Mucilaginibacter myungsuensis]MBE9663215.1 Rrf2 family transcriptional regulator [Mucilaginibacter myungsuensis]MDN3598848.1 Rrf2 family transcriptional regulator [Mucilaginibacter myungsuensis]
MLSRKAKYAIKTLILLGKQEQGIMISASYIADSERIPKKSLESILSDLKNAEFIYNRKGLQGGYHLIRPLDKIFLVDIVRLMDGPIAQVTCASAYHYRRCDECPIEETCAIRDLYTEIRAADLQILSRTSIASMIEKERELAEGILGVA